ncbi:hypothetical protein SteCoe_30192 [Stentor coeruleus]|uniref:Uncharacterized protein n=1 Tax=Stentor coeruleus TaxID=5963 RepID=A0A1R2B459_9CILI|nr:hypothetical protein SteCoe_30192 [Stentor coeruleus]
MSYNANDKFWTQRVQKEEQRIFRELKSRGELNALRDAERLSNFSSYHGINVRKPGQGLKETIERLEIVLEDERKKRQKAENTVKKLKILLRSLENSKDNIESINK